MKLLINYQYKGHKGGRPVRGSGSARMSVVGDKVTEDVMDNCLGWIERKLESEGKLIDEIETTGWLRFEEEAPE
jgi:hypothetical protein